MEPKKGRGGFRHRADLQVGQLHRNRQGGQRRITRLQVGVRVTYEILASGKRTFVGTVRSCTWKKFLEWRLRGR